MQAVRECKWREGGACVYACTGARARRVGSQSGFTEWVHRVGSQSGFTEWVHALGSDLPHCCRNLLLDDLRCGETVGGCRRRAGETELVDEACQTAARQHDRTRVSS